MDRILNANVKVHEALLDAGEYQKSPHRSPENVNKVSNKISQFLNGKKIAHHLDLGCGDGFVFECFSSAKAQFGIDASLGMLSLARKTHPKVKFSQENVYNLPFQDNFFDFVTCYSFLDHLEDRKSCYEEVFRVLKPGGVIYFGLSPNKRFISAFNDVQYSCRGNLHTLEKFNHEKMKALSNGEHYFSEYGISQTDLDLCEPGKNKDGGMDPYSEALSLESIGFSNVKFEMEWMIGENLLNENVLEVLRSSLPFSIPVFKYFELFGEKNG